MNYEYVQSISQDLAFCIFSRKFSANIRSSRPDVFCKKGVLKYFARFKGKHLCKSLFFNKGVGLRCAKFLRTPFFIEHLWWLLQLHKKLRYQIFS